VTEKSKKGSLLELLSHSAQRMSREEVGEGGGRRKEEEREGGGRREKGEGEVRERDLLELLSTTENELEEG
jgi:hypothetical protein